MNTNKVELNMATPRPWKQGEEAYAGIYAEDGFLIASCSDGINHDKPHRANAALIVTAVNLFEAHEELEKEAIAVNAKIQQLRDLSRPEDLCLAEPGDCDEEFDGISNALAKLATIRGKGKQ